MIRRTVETRTAEIALTIFLSRIFLFGVHDRKMRDRKMRMDWFRSLTPVQSSPGSKKISAVTKEDQRAIFLAHMAGRSIKTGSR